jgi:hypothetical protein
MPEQRVDTVITAYQCNVMNPVVSSDRRNYWGTPDASFVLAKPNSNADIISTQQDLSADSSCREMDVTSYSIPWFFRLRDQPNRLSYRVIESSVASMSGLRPDNISASTLPEPHAMVQPRVPWPVLRWRLL